MTALKNTEFEPYTTGPTDNEKNKKGTVVNKEHDATFTSTLSLDNEYLSSTGTFDKIVLPEQPQQNVSRETVLSSGSYQQLYRLFRSENHHVISAALRALCQRCDIRYQQSATEIRQEYSAIQTHPHGWSQDKKDTHKSNKWLVMRMIFNTLVLLCEGLLIVLLAPFRLLAWLGHAMDDALHGTRTLLSAFITLLLYLGAGALITYTVYAVRTENDRNYLLRIYLDDTYVGDAANVTDVLNGKHQYEKTLGDAYGTPVILPCTLRYEPVTADEADSGHLITANDMSVFESYMDTYLADGYGLYIDNKLVAVAPVAKWINNAVEQYKSMQQQNYMRYYHQNVPDSFVLTNSITVLAGKYPKNYFLTQHELRSLFYLETEEDKSEENNPNTLDYTRIGKNTVQDSSGDFLSTMPSAETVEVSFNMIAEETAYEDIPYTTEYVYDDTMYQGMRRMIRSGVKGKKAVQYRVTYSDNKIVAREVISETTLREPVGEVVRSGTMEVPENLKGLLPTGSYIFPYNGTITSKFGWRSIFGGTSFHKGVDIFGPYGSILVAADGGEVIETSSESTYGNYVLIRHDENTVTRYAHCDSFLVNVGDLVGQGYPIAKMGMSGRATGVHVHFEIIKNGSVVDPEQYARFK